MRSTRSRTRGVSLIEALVALAVMAFGTLAVLGVQTSLRLNADIAKQRSEAVRIAQETLEAARAFDNLDTYSALADVEDAAVAGYATANTVYQVTQTVTDTAAADAANPRRKGLVVDVTWTDRAGQPQSVRLASVIQGVAPALAGSLAVPAKQSAALNPGHRNPSIPPFAVDVGGGKSRFRPPGSDARWVFDNVTADITRVCTDDALANCVDIDARLLAGYVRFATDAALPSAAHALLPPGAVDAAEVAAVDVAVALTAPVGSVASCYAQTLDIRTRAYYCAVPVAETGWWSGRSSVEGLLLAGNVADAAGGDARRVCRYTPVRDCHPIVGSTIWGEPDATDSCVGAAPTPSRIMRNADHPLDYSKVTGPLVDQNFLVVRAGDGNEPAYPCPGDVAGDYVNSNTWHHQPAN